MAGINLCTYRRVRRFYHSLTPRERRGLTPERLAALEAAAQLGANV